jgi:Domain of unknown function (DUF4397)
VFGSNNASTYFCTIFEKLRVMKKLLMSLLAAATVATTITSCNKDETTIPLPAKSNPNLTVVQAAPGASNVNLFIDGTSKGSSLGYLTNTGYSSISDGVRNIKVTEGINGTTVIDKKPTFEKDKSYTLFIANRTPSIEGVLIADDLTAPLEGKAHVRFVHVGSDAPAVDVAETGGLVLFPNVAFKGFSAFKPINAGTVTLEARIAGTTTVALPLGSLTFVAGKIYTIYARGLISGSSLGVTVIENK